MTDAEQQGEVRDPARRGGGRGELAGFNRGDGRGDRGASSSTPPRRSAASSCSWPIRTAASTWWPRPTATIRASLMVTTEWSDWRAGTFWWIQSVYVRPRTGAAGSSARSTARPRPGAARPATCAASGSTWSARTRARSARTRRVGMHETVYRLCEDGFDLAVTPVRCLAVEDHGGPLDGQSSRPSRARRFFTCRRTWSAYGSRRAFCS